MSHSARSNQSVGGSSNRSQAQGRGAIPCQEITFFRCPERLAALGTRLVPQHLRSDQRDNARLKFYRT